MTATPAAVRIRGLRKIYRPARYREVAPLNGLDLDIGAGEIVALLGPNGAGKTTAVQILTACRRRDAGGGDRVSAADLPSGTGPVRVPVADDHPVVRAGLRALLGAEPGLAVVAEAGSGERPAIRRAAPGGRPPACPPRMRRASHESGEPPHGEAQWAGRDYLPI